MFNGSVSLRLVLVEFNAIQVKPHVIQEIFQEQSSGFEKKNKSRKKSKKQSAKKLTF